MLLRFDRYCLRTVFCLFGLIFAALSVSYLIIDSLVSGHLLNWQRAIWLLLELGKRLGLLISISWTLATLHTWTQLQLKGQFVALQIGGWSRSRIARPFLIAGLLITCVLIWAEGWGMPAARALYTNQRKQRPTSTKQVRSEFLVDGSVLVSFHLERTPKQLHDVIWIRPDASFWHIEDMTLGTHQWTLSNVDQIRLQKAKPPSLSSAKNVVIPSIARTQRAHIKQASIPKSVPLAHRASHCLWPWAILAWTLTIPGVMSRRASSPALVIASALLCLLIGYLLLDALAAIASHGMSKTAGYLLGIPLCGVFSALILRNVQSLRGSAQ